jgi:hypothetical protein
MTLALGVNSVHNVYKKCKQVVRVSVDNQHTVAFYKGRGRKSGLIQRVTHEANEGLQCDFFNDGLEVHHKGFSGTDDALVIENYHL